MKDLILIGSYCPDYQRENYLNKLVDQLQYIKNDVDILICSHTPIPEYITEKVDFVFYKSLLLDQIYPIGIFE